jgi:predicted DNA-binding protein
MGHMARVRIDEDANTKLDNACEIIGATKSGLASEMIREASEEIIEEHKDGN